MKKIYLFLILSFTAFESYAQNNEFINLKNNYDRLRKEEKQDSALLIAKQMNTWALKNEGDTSLRFAASYSLIADVFLMLQNNDSAIYFYNLSRVLFINQNRVSGTDYLKTINNLSDLYFYLDNYKKAEPFYIEALNITKRIIGEINPEYLNKINNLAYLYKVNGNHKSAESYYKQSIVITKKLYGEHFPEYTSILEEIGRFYFNIFNYYSAEKYFKKALEIKKNELDEQHPSSQSNLNSLGVLYGKTGDYHLAEKCLKQVIEIKQKGMDTSLSYATNLNNLGLLYFAIGDYKRTELYLKLSLEVIKKYRDENNLNAMIKNNLGLMYVKKNEYSLAESCYKLALEILNHNLEDGSSDFGLCLNNISCLYIEMGNYKLAEENLLKALDFLENCINKKYGEVYSTTLNNLGVLFFLKGDYLISENYLNQSKDILKKIYPDCHPSFLEIEKNLAKVYIKTGRIKDAMSIYETSFVNLNNYIITNFEWMNDKEKNLFWNSSKKFYNTIDQFATEYSKEFPQITILSYNSNLFTKGKLLEAKISKENDLAEIVELREKLSFIRKKLAKLDESDDVKQYNKLDEEANLLDSKLTLLWSEYATQKKNLSITWDQVQGNLAIDEAAIEFVRYKSDKDSQYYYNALIVRKTDVYPVLVPLCSENQFKEVLNKGFSAYYPLVWAPMDDYLKEIKTIYYSPVGLLNKIPFAALYSQKNGGDKVTYDKKTKKIVSKTESDANYLMNIYTLHQLTSTRYLAMGLKEKAMDKIDKSIALIGGVNYNYLPGVNKKTVKKEMLLATREANYSQPLGFLEGTKIEVDAISKQMQNNGWTTTLLENDSATEDNVIKYENQAAKGIFHFATHGFAFPNIKELPANSDSNISKNSFCYYTNPLQRCGLILAGANWTWMGCDELKKRNPEAEDGILTAAQVALLNLRKTKLVVLSACETGLGKIEGSEGVLGLTRAFKLAGVEQIIVSLWEVPDKETMELMTIFYEDLSKTQNAIISFEKAQKTMSSKYPNRPDLWAGFVLVR